MSSVEGYKHNWNSRYELQLKYEIQESLEYF
jgi:hypothetical protein